MVTTSSAKSYRHFKHFLVETIDSVDFNCFTCFSASVGDERMEINLNKKSMGFHVTIELDVVDHSLVLQAREGAANCNTSLACN